MNYFPKMKNKYKKIEKPSKPLGETVFLRLKLPHYLTNLKPYIIKYIGPKRIKRMEKLLK